MIRFLTAAAAFSLTLAVLGFSALLRTDGLTWLAVSATCGLLVLILRSPVEEEL